MTSRQGHRLKLSIPRRMVCDLLRVSQSIPVVTFERRMDLADVIVARKRLPHPPAWALLFAKAFSAMATNRPEFRRAYLPYPWPHLWQADESIASIAIERDFHGESGVFFGFLKAPDKHPLAHLVAQLEDWKTKPVEEIRPFTRQIRYARLPAPARRLLWHFGTAWSGRAKAKNFGTFGVSLTGASNATALNLIGPLTTALNTGVIQENGTVDVRLHFDHRVLDGMPVSRGMAEMEGYLHTNIVTELFEMVKAKAA